MVGEATADDPDLSVEIVDDTRRRRDRPLSTAGVIDDLDGQFGIIGHRLAYHLGFASVLG